MSLTKVEFDIAIHEVVLSSDLLYHHIIDELECSISLQFRDNMSSPKKMADSDHQIEEDDGQKG